jgi:hypothetical protein
VDSPIIDEANPALLAQSDPIDFDYFAIPRPDGGTENEQGLVSPYLSDMGAIEWVKMFACEIEPAGETRTLARGESTLYTITITNTGGLDPLERPAGYQDTLTVRLANSSEGWATLVGGVEQTFDLAWQQSTVVQLQVDVPLGALTTDVENSLIECESVSSGATESATFVTQVESAPGVDIGPDRDGLTAVPGQILTFTHTVTNTGNNPDTFEIFPNPGLGFANVELLNADGTLLTNNRFFLEPAQTYPVYLRATILGTAPEGGVANPGAVVRSIAVPEEVT